MPIVHYSTNQLRLDVLSKAGPEELLVMTQIFDAEANHAITPEELTNKITTAGGHAVGNWLRDQGIAYTELLHDVAMTLNITPIKPLDELTITGLMICEMDERALLEIVDPLVSGTWHRALDQYISDHEQSILKKFMSDTYKKMTQNDRSEVDKKVIELAKQMPGSGISGLTKPAAFLVVANAGGFATYTLMSSIISTLTAGMAGFGVYTTASSLLSVVIGPAGWAALGFAGLYKLGKPNKEQCLRSVIAIAMLRCQPETKSEKSSLFFRAIELLRVNCFCRIW